MLRNTFHGDSIGRLCGDGGHKQVGIDLVYRGKLDGAPRQRKRKNKLLLSNNLLAKAYRSLLLHVMCMKLELGRATIESLISYSCAGCVMYAGSYICTCVLAIDGGFVTCRGFGTLCLIIHVIVQCIVWNHTKMYHT